MILIGLPLLLYLSLALVYLQERSAQTTAFARVRTSLDLLRRPTPDLKAVEADIAQADAAISEARSSFEQESSEALIAGLLDRAERSGLEVVGIAARPVVTRKEDDKSYSVLPISIQALGGTGQVLGFINSLDYPSMQVENVSLSMGEEGYNATLELVVHLTPKE